MSGLGETLPYLETVLCNRPPDIPNGFHNAPKGQDSFPAGTVLTYKCEARFRADGQERAMCREDGTWSGPNMFCKVKNRKNESFKNCGFPGELVNGRREGNRFRFPGKVTYHCNEGYELHGQPVRECQANGVWSGSLPVCKPIRCPELHAPLNGHMSGSGNTYNTVLKFHCPTGFNIVGSSERRCMSNHQWSGQPTRCEAVKQKFCAMFVLYKNDTLTISKILNGHALDKLRKNNRGWTKNHEV
eukprot:XP_014782140.1 PREDICTED: protein lev-9-like [Octopus bimaculoides]